MNAKHLEILNNYNAEFVRTTGKKQGNAEYGNGWFTIYGYRKTKVRAKDIVALTEAMKSEPTAVETQQLVNGVMTTIPADSHVVKSVVGNHEVVEAKDTPYGCSVGDEAYWSN